MFLTVVGAFLLCMLSFLIVIFKGTGCSEAVSYVCPLVSPARNHDESHGRPICHEDVFGPSPRLQSAFRIHIGQLLLYNAISCAGTARSERAASQPSHRHRHYNIPAHTLSSHGIVWTVRYRAVCTPAVPICSLAPRPFALRPSRQHLERPKWVSGHAYSLTVLPPSFHCHAPKVSANGDEVAGTETRGSWCLLAPRHRCQSHRVPRIAQAHRHLSHKLLNNASSVPHLVDPSTRRFGGATNAEDGNAFTVGWACSERTVGLCLLLSAYGRLIKRTTNCQAGCTNGILRRKIRAFPR
ncbi:hypothetical protein C8Q79DRAFT_3442 [Trametes meyenii]|nr:hypothetical protein C8Q79DRAFT_3442 [Trametes meyenii]